MTPADHRSRGERTTSRAAAEAADLIYELLDAHDDTVRIAAELTCDPRWEAHLDYLRSLQRRGRELLAQMSPERR